MVASGPSSNYDEADFNHGLLETAGALAVSQVQIPSAGCNIKWIEGNSPEYFVADS